MKTTITHLSKILSLSALTFIVACTQGNQALQKPKGAPAAPTVAPQPAPSKALGTTDGGGGNAINGKMLESYIIHPEELPAVKNKLAEIVKGAFSSPEEAGTKDDKDGNLIFKLKTWYLVPMNLNQVNKKALGIEFTEDQTEQVAIQTKDEIWINSQIFEKMSEEEQAKLILHEVVMNYYLLKFQKLSEMCGQIRKVGGDCGGNISLETLDEILKPEAERELNAQDYVAIRYITRWLWEKGSMVSRKEFHEVAIASGFDRRFQDTAPTNDKEVTLTKEELIEKLEVAKYSGKLRQKCSIPDLKSTLNCELEFAVIIDEKYGQSFAKLKFTLKDLDRGAVIADSESNIADRTHLYLSSSGSSSLYVLGFMSNNIFISEDGSAVKPGTVGYYFDFVFNEDLSQLTGVAVVPVVALTPSTVLIERIEDGVKNEYRCKKQSYTSLKGTQVAENLIVLGRDYVLSGHAELKFKNFNFTNSSDCKKVEN